MAQALKQGQPDQLLMELNSAVSTMATEKQEIQLAELIARQKTAFMNFKTWLQKHETWP